MSHRVSHRHHLPAAVAALVLCCAGSAEAARLAGVELTNGSDPARPLLLADAAALEASLNDYRGQPDTDAVRESLADAVLRHYQAAGWPVVDVEVLRGDRGQAVVQVQEGRFGEIAVTGGSAWMRKAAFADWTRRKGSPLTSEGLAADLAWLHRNPFHAATISFSPGAETATADATLTLQDTRPVRLYAGWRNDGAPPLDRVRFYAGIEVADIAGLPSWLNLEVLAGDDGGYSGGRGTLRLFLPCHHELRLSGYWTQAESTTALLPGFDSVTELEAWNVSLRWLIPLPAWRGWRSDFALGADFYRLDSSVRALGSGVRGEADALHLTAGLHAVRRSGAWQSGVEAEAAYSPGGITGSADGAHHTALRRGAQAQYTLLRAGAWTQRELSGGWTATGRVSGQWSSDPLLPVQAFSPAGAAGVRGFAPSSALGDDGVAGSIEVLTPLLPLPVENLHLRAAAFVDAAQVHDAVTGHDESLAAAGAGLRLRMAESAGLTLDYGWRLTEPGGRLHLAVRVEF